MVRAEELIQLIDSTIADEKAEAVLEKVKIENYHLGKVEGYQELKKRIIEAINKEVEETASAEMPEKTEEKTEKTPAKKK